jgi:WD40 repeat protein
LASGLDNGTIQLWDTATGVLRQTFEGHSGMINSVTFSSDGRLLAASSIASTIQLWDTATGVLRQTFEGHSEMINSVTLSSDGRLLAAGSIAGTIQLWDTETGVFPLTFEGHLGKINSVTFSSDGRLLAAGSSNGTIQLCDTVKGTLQGTLRGHSHSVRSLEFKLLTHSELLLESHYHDGTVQSWDIRIGKRLLTRESQSPSVGSSAFSPNRWRPNPPRANLMISIYQEQWITLNGKKVLWLPPGYRPTCSAFKDSILALGHASGQVSFIGFEV